MYVCTVVVAFQQPASISGRGGVSVNRAFTPKSSRETTLFFYPVSFDEKFLSGGVDYHCLHIIRRCLCRTFSGVWLSVYWAHENLAPPPREKSASR